MSWTDARVEQLKAARLSGDSFGIIAEALGISRNAAIGKAHRIGLTRPSDGAPRREKSRAHKTVYKHGPPKRKAILNEVAQLARLSGESLTFELPPDRIDDLLIPQEQRRTLLELEEYHCRFPIGTPGELGFFFCAGPAVADRPYCAPHCAVAFQPRGR